ncbi:MAG TPA: hypothetical protein VK142_09325 [Bacillota bacterium]|nr:hypothetical protein [Bacillota bacterium]
MKDFFKWISGGSVGNGDGVFLPHFLTSHECIRYAGLGILDKRPFNKRDSDRYACGAMDGVNIFTHIMPLLFNLNTPEPFVF